MNLNLNLNLSPDLIHLLKLFLTPSVNSASDADRSSSPAPEISLDSILDIPKEGKYSQVRRYIHERCRFDPEFKRRVEDSSRVELCTFLTHRFGWVVDPNSLGKNMNRKH